MQNNEDVFKDSMSEALEKSMEEALIENKKQERIAEIVTIAKERLAEGETQWDLLKRMIDGSMTERFIKSLEAMSDKDFSRNYLKLLEHFKPKITRMEEGDVEAPDLTINIQTMVINSKGEKEIIPLTSLNKEDGD